MTEIWSFAMLWTVLSAQYLLNWLTSVKVITPPIRKHINCHIVLCNRWCWTCRHWWWSWRGVWATAPSLSSSSSPHSRLKSETGALRSGRDWLESESVLSPLEVKVLEMRFLLRSAVFSVSWVFSAKQKKSWEQKKGNPVQSILWKKKSLFLKKIHLGP